jgi:hypothetical protein
MGGTVKSGKTTANGDSFGNGEENAGNIRR